MLLDEEQKAEQQQIEPTTTPTVVSSGLVTETAPEMIHNSIEAKAAGEGEGEQKKKPFSKKTVILTIIFFIVSLVIVFLTIRFILKIDWQKFFWTVSNSFQYKSGYLWFFMLLVVGFVNILRNFVTLMPRIRSYGCKISFGEYLLFGITCSFLGLVTPFSIVSDPYCVFWMKTHGISTSKCASLMFSNGFLYQISQFVITLPAFIICCINRHQLFDTAEAKAIFSLICIGAIFDMFNFAFTLVMCLWKQAHYFLARVFNWFKKIFRMKYHTKEQTREKYKKNEAIKRDFINYMKDWKTTLLTFGLYAAGDMIGTMALSWGMYFVQWTPILNTFPGVGADSYDVVKVGFNYWLMFNCARLSNLANRINFIPGQQIGYEWTLSVLCMRYGGWHEILPATATSFYTDAAKSDARMLLTTNGTFIVRIFGSYLPSLIGIGGFVALTVRQFRESRKGDLIKHIY